MENIFKNSSFFQINKDEFLNSEVQDIISKFNYPETAKYHPERAKEFLLGRYCAFMAFKNLLGSELLSIPRKGNRSPLWPSHIVGSITHNGQWVACVIAEKKRIRSVGLDIEDMGRIKLSLINQITTEYDIKEHIQLSREELLTIIFSAKESLYKLLYPIVEKFFGLEAAYVSEINFSNQTFKIHLLHDLNDEFGPGKLACFEGHFRIENNTCLTYLELNEP